jgi:phage shock protein PspC (stress-responsive transcriptional regulator)
MTEQPSQQYAPPSGGAGDRWSRRPRRSANDRKIAGVAGGLGRAFGVDPIILRVAFVVLAIFGGSGVLLYALGWLLLPNDGDEVSAVEGMLGRGRSSVSPLLTVLLIVVALSSAGSVFSWGLPFWPVVIGAIVLFLVARRSRLAHGPGWTSRGWGSDGPTSPGPTSGGWGSRGDRDWNQWGNDVADRANRWANDFSQRASQWGQRTSRWGGPGGCGRGMSRPGTDDPARSPFDGPAFWDADPRSATTSSAAAPRPSSGSGAANAAPHGPTGPADATATTPGTAAMGTDAGAGGPAGTANAATTGPDEVRAPSPSEMLTGNRQPPAWDPLGVAPFAWDLPDPTPVAAPPAAHQHRGVVLARVFVGLALLAGALSAAGVIAGWWALTWAEVSAIALSVVGVGLILAAMRGRGHGRPLIGPGIFLALLTMALSVTGINGTRDYGAQTWTPTTAAAIDQQTFSWNAGDGTLDLSGVTIPAETTATTTLDVRAGEATVIVPAGVTVHAVCSATVGRVDCLGSTDQGLRPSVTVVAAADSGTAGSGGTAGSAGTAGSGGTATGGTLDLIVRVGAGHVAVKHG